MRSLTVDECSVVSGGLLQKPFFDVGAFDDGLSSGGLGALAYLLEKQGGGSGEALETVYVTAQRDYCGSGFTSGVPDNPLGHEFREACKLHDGLFEILSGNYGKILADAIFLNAMLEWCNKNAPGDQSCRNMAYVYFAAVAVFGWPAYALAGTAGRGQ